EPHTTRLIHLHGAEVQLVDVTKSPAHVVGEDSGLQSELGIVRDSNDLGVVDEGEDHHTGPEQLGASNRPVRIDSAEDRRLDALLEGSPARQHRGSAIDRVAKSIENST